MRRMKGWLVCAALIASPSFGTDAVTYPTQEFQALPRPERNLAVYDAFWGSLESNYYDPQLLAAKKWRSLRKAMRERAANEPDEFELYKKVFGEIAAEFPDSHVAAELPPSIEDAPLEVRRVPAKRVREMVALLGYGPGYTSTQVRRGNKTYGLVTEVAPHSPAATAGIEPGWRVVRSFSSVSIDFDAVNFFGEFIPLTPREAEAWERGELEPMDRDQWRSLKITFEHRPFDVRPPVESRRLGTGTRYLRFDEFGDDRFMAPVFSVLDETGSSALILDLRWNVGGLAVQLQKLAGVLLGEVPLGTLQNSHGSELLLATKPARRVDGPLVLLIGPATGSCSEILAAAVQDYQRGRLIGRMTNGSTLVAQGFRLPDGGVIQVPVSDFRTTRDQRIEGAGVTPDIRVMPTLDDVRAGRDVAVERALALLGQSAGESVRTSAQATPQPSSGR